MSLQQFTLDFVLDQHPSLAYLPSHFPLLSAVFLLLFLFLLFYEVSLFIFLSFIYINKVPGPFFLPYTLFYSVLI
jgi:hypothetical protein